MLCAAVAATVPTMNRHTHTRHLRSAATASKSVVVVAAPPPPPAAAAAASVTVPSSEQWRCYGQARRRWLVENDKAAISFRMNAACSIHKYFSLAERVSFCVCACAVWEKKCACMTYLHHQCSTIFSFFDRWFRGPLSTPAFFITTGHFAVSALVRAGCY